MKTLTLCVVSQTILKKQPHNFLLNSNDCNPYRCVCVCVCVCVTEKDWDFLKSYTKLNDCNPYRGVCVCVCDRERLGLLKSYTKLTYYTKLGKPTSLLPISSAPEPSEHYQPPTKQIE